VLAATQISATDKVRTFMSNSLACADGTDSLDIDRGSEMLREGFPLTRAAPGD
jgi:hypothetical protein